MQTIKLTLNELLILEVELNGEVDVQSKQKVSSGFLGEKMNLATKYWMATLSEKLVAEKTIVEGLQNELITKYGEEKDGEIRLETYLNVEEKVFNPKVIQYYEELNELLSQEKEIEYNPLSVSDLAKIESSGNYRVIFKLVLNG